MKRMICCMLVLGFCVQPLIAEDGEAAHKLVRNTVDKVLKVVENKELEGEARREKIMEVLNPVFDFPLMAKLTLGKKYWPTLSEEKKKEFVDLFVQQLRNAYMEKIEMVAGETVEVAEPKVVKTKVYVASHVVSKGEKVNLLYKLYKSNGDWKVYDFEIEGISSVRSYGSQYTQILRNESVDALLKKMQEKLDEKK